MLRLSLRWRFLAVLASGVTTSQPPEEHAAAEAAAYWRGRRVQALDEPNLPTPIFHTGGDVGTLSIDYQGEPQVQECMEYYLDKIVETAARDHFLHQEREESAEWAMKNPPGGEPVKGIVTYFLMENSQRTLHLDLLLSLHCLAKYFGTQYPVAVFHTNGSTAAELNKLRNSGPRGLTLILEEVYLDFPLSVSGMQGGVDSFFAPPLCTMDGQDWWVTHRSCGCRCPAWRPQCWPLNWMHCTRFFTAGMFRTETFRAGNFDFFLRMDTDLFFVVSPLLDPFRLMATRGCAMVYDRISRETPGCHDGFDNFTVAYLKKYFPAGLSYDTKVLRLGHGPAAAGGGWTIGNARLFTSRAYLHFADNAARGIYANRWADQLLLLRGVALFGPRSSFHPDSNHPPVSLCLEPFFDGGPEHGFVHEKGGFRNQDLLEKCSATAAFA